MDREKTLATVKRGSKLAVDGTVLVGGIVIGGSVRMAKDIWSGLKSIIKETRDETRSEEAPQD